MVTQQRYDLDPEGCRRVQRLTPHPWTCLVMVAERWNRTTLVWVMSPVLNAPAQVARTTYRDSGGTRTPNRLFRKEVPCPLGYGTMVVRVGVDPTSAAYRAAALPLS